MPPDVHRTTRRQYDDLPEHYRIADLRQADDQPLLRFLSLIGDQLGELEDLIDRINYVSPNDGGAPGDTSDLVDPATADPAWLPFLAQLNGIALPAGVDVATRRALIAAAPAGWRAATKEAIAAAAQTVLSGGKYTVVTDHFAGDPWQIEVRTRTSETPSDTAVVDAIIAARAKPAGHIIINTRYGASWAEIAERFPTWADIIGRSWLDVLETTSTPTAPTPVSDTLELRWKVRAAAADTAELRWRVLGSTTPVSDTLDARWRVRTNRRTDILANDSPLIYLDFGDAAGSTADDSSPNNRDGTYWPLGVALNQASIIPTDTAGHAVSLDGATTGDGGAITTNYQPFGAGTARTFRGVVKRSSHANRHALFGSDSGTTMLALNAGNNDVLFWPNTSASSAAWLGAWPGDNVAVEWALKFDDAAHTAELLINGVSKGVVTGMPAYGGPTQKLTIGARYGASLGFVLDNFHGIYDAFDIVDGLTGNTVLATRYAAHF